MAVSEGAAAAAFYREDAAGGSRVVQHRAEGTVHTDLPGNVWRLDYSPDGRLLLVHHQLPGGGSNHGIGHRTLLDATGDVLWTVEDDRSYVFSTTGEVIYAWYGLSEGGGGKSMELFDLTGKSLRKLTAEKDIWGVLVRGAGERILLETHRTLLCAGAADQLLWSIEIPPDEPEPASILQPFGKDRFVLRQGLGIFKVFRWDGAIEYEYRPEILAARDPDKTPKDYMQYAPYAGPTSETLVLLDHRTCKGLLLDLTTRRLESYDVDPYVPPGYKLRSIQDGHLVLLGPDAILLRSISEP